MTFQHSARLLLVFALSFVGAATAKRNDPEIALTFRPQQAIAGATAEVTPAMRDRPIILRVLDGRPPGDSLALGTRTDDDDRIHELRATGDVVAFVDGVLRELARGWGLRVEPVADRVLQVELASFQITETNQAVGATFEARALLAVELHDAGGNRLWSGTASGDATRYGRKYSNENCNEVLSDALLEAFAATLSTPGLQASWVGAAAGSFEPSDGDGPLVTEAPLEELLLLIQRGSGEDALVDRMKGRLVTMSLAAAALARSKELGAPRGDLRVALRRPIG